jgi:hypothetical protein
VRQVRRHTVSFIVDPALPPVASRRQGPPVWGRKDLSLFINRISEFHHHLLLPFIRTGDTVVDCTVGNGHDALFLAERTGKEGRLIGFDVQEEALENTRERLLEGGIDAGRFTLILDTHERIDRYVSAGIAAAVYNLGYLPGGDRAVVTGRDGTIGSIGKALELLRPEGVVSVTLYCGHKGAAEEAEGVLHYAGSLDPGFLRVLHLHYPNQPNGPPSILIIQRMR